jgi:dTDP-4-dehydrorhamnose 3,5-epimerase
MKVTGTAIADVLLIEAQVFGDARGFFLETFRENVFAAHGMAGPFVQDNHSGSQGNALRGLHYQLRQPQGKLVRVVAGEIFDVAVDLRRRSPSFGGWVGVRLSAQNRLQLWVPPGFAHGFYVTSDWAEVTYKATDYYAPEWERTLLWNDPQVGIDWPLSAEQPILSAKDAQGKRLAEAEVYEDLPPTPRRG